MKIKTVSEFTGLSDRAIRYYIEQGLILPSYSEDYLGRKAFDFSQEDISNLQNIAVLRKFDFSIEEIKEIILDSENSKAIIQNVKTRNEQALATERVRQSVLSQIEDDKAYTVAELALELSEASAGIPKTEEKIKRDIGKTIRTAVKAVPTFLVVWLPVAFQFLFFTVTLLIYAYPKFHPGAVWYMVLSVLPTVLVVLLRKIKLPWQKVTRKILLVLCAISLLCSLVICRLPAGIMAISETTDFAEYRDVDADCLANRDPFFQELFPMWPNYIESIVTPDGDIETVYLDARYYYRYLSIMDYTYDIYAEWPLDEETFNKEVARVTKLFEEKNFQTIQKGNYTCLVYSDDPVFEEVTDSYTYYIFAYDERSLKVRYICCCSLENGADQPYYLSLDW